MDIPRTSASDALSARSHLAAASAAAETAALRSALRKDAKKKRSSSVPFPYFAAAILGVAGLAMAALPWLLMLTLGNFGHASYGFWSCVPPGLLLTSLAGRGSAGKRGSAK